MKLILNTRVYMHVYRFLKILNINIACSILKKVC